MSREKSLPFMPLAVDNLLVGLMTMTDADAGRYVRLLLLAWAKGPFDKRTANAASPMDHDAVGVDAMLVQKFVKQGSKWTHEKIEKSFAAQLSKVEGGRRGGIESARVRQGSGQGSGQGSSQQSESESELEPEADLDSELDPVCSDSWDRRFDKFWLVVHRKQGKKKSRAAFTVATRSVADELKIDLDAAASRIVTAMFNFAGSEDARDDVKGSLLPTTWLNQGRYDDDQELWDGKRAGRTPDVVKKVAAKLTIDNVRFDLLKTYGVQESREWTDARCIAEHKKLRARK